MLIVLVDFLGFGWRVKNGCKRYFEQLINILLVFIKSLWCLGYYRFEVFEVKLLLLGL